LSPHDHVDPSDGLAAARNDLNCSREPIRVPGLIQPHGVYLAIDPLDDFTVVAASRNASALLPAVRSSRELIGKRIGTILGEDFAMAIRQRFQAGRLRGEAPLQSTLDLPPSDVPALDMPAFDVAAFDVAAFDVAVHAHADLVHVELEPAGAHDEADALVSVRQLQEAIIDLREARGELEGLAWVAARGVRLLMGYERVLVYRFDADWNGQAIAEDKVADWEQSLDGLHFPASDIPAQARELYRRSLMRWVPDRDAVPVPLEYGASWTRDPPLSRVIDLSFARLRHLSPVHLQYHRNMGVNGSMSLSILHEGRLWGLMVCHHRRPHHPSAGQRGAAAALTDAFALRIGPAEHIDTEQARRDDLARLSTLLSHMAEAEMVITALTAGDVTISSLFASTGAAVLYDGKLSMLGSIPPEADVRELIAWLRLREAPATLFQSDNLAALYPPWQPHTAIASGVLAVFLSPDRSDMLLWFRPEEPHLVSWGGSPHKAGGRGRTGAAPALVRAMGRDAARPRAALGRVGAGDGGDAPARHHRGDGARPAPDRRAAREAAPEPEDGGCRPAHRRHRARLQQPADRDHRQPGAFPHPCQPGTVRRPGPLPRPGDGVGQPGGGADPPPAGILAAADARHQDR